MIPGYQAPSLAPPPGKGPFLNTMGPQPPMNMAMGPPPGQPPMAPPPGRMPMMGPTNGGIAALQGQMPPGIHPPMQAGGPGGDPMAMQRRFAMGLRNRMPGRAMY